MNKLILIFRLSIIFIAINIYSQEIFVVYSQKIPVTNFLIEMAAIPGGEFKMGSPMNEKNRLADEGPQRKVVVDSFWMAKHETTWNLFQLYMDREIDKNQIRNVNNEIDIDVDGVSSATTPYVEMSFGMGTDGYPAISMTQLSASKFCEWLSAMTGNYYRLPTEAEWEYACRAGSSGPYHFDENLETLDDYAWYSTVKTVMVNIKKLEQKNLTTLGYLICTEMFLSGHLISMIQEHIQTKLIVFYTILIIMQKNCIQELSRVVRV